MISIESRFHLYTTEVTCKGVRKRAPKCDALGGRGRKLSISKGRGFQFDFAEVIGYEERVGMFVDYLVFLGQMTSGLTGRVREVISMKFCHTWHTMRNVFIQGGDK